MSKRARSATIVNLSRRLAGFDLQGRIQLQRAGKVLELSLEFIYSAYSLSGAFRRFS